MTTHVKGRDYDIIFAGGGAAACAAAGRLAEADPNLAILVVERGKNNLNDPTVTNPAAFLSHLAPTSNSASFYEAVKEKALNDRQAVVATGGILGGGSSINFMMYTRAQGVDYDSWNTEGWDASSLLPFAKKLERYHLDHPAIDKSLHGYGGPIHISNGTYCTEKMQDDFLNAAEAVGLKEIIDLQDFKSIGGFSRWLKYISPDGKRQDAAHAYIHPLMASGKYPNLHLLLESTVDRVIFEGNRAIGIAYESTATTQPATELNTKTPLVVKARKLVIVSSGALSSPSTLERSGIGSAERLKKLDIPLVSDLPGVGEAYQDHHMLTYPYKTSLKAEETLDGLLSGRLNFATALNENNPIIGWNGIDIAGKLRPSDAEVAQLGPDFEELWKRDYKAIEGKPLALMVVGSSYLGDHKVLNEEDGVEQYSTMGTITAYPYSRGNIHIDSKDPKATPLFNTGFLSHSADLKTQVWAYKKQREIYRRTNSYAGELHLGHPKFRAGSKASLCQPSRGGSGFKNIKERKTLPPIEYDAEDDDAIEDWIRSNLNTTWHSMGTCKMGPIAQGGVVDKDLNVYGTEGLKVVDLSIVPHNVGSNTYNTALIIGEKAAHIVATEFGLAA